MSSVRLIVKIVNYATIYLLVPMEIACTGGPRMKQEARQLWHQAVHMVQAAANQPSAFEQ
jgi:hypothetical protein